MMLNDSILDENSSSQDEKTDMLAVWIKKEGGKIAIRLTVVQTIRCGADQQTGLTIPMRSI